MSEEVTALTSGLEHIPDRSAGHPVVVPVPVVLFADDLELDGIGGDAGVASTPVGEKEDVEAQLGDERAQRGVDAKQVLD